MKKLKRFFLIFAILAVVLPVFAVGCRQGDAKQADDGYTQVAQEEAIEVLIDYTKQFIASDNSKVSIDNGTSLNGNFKSEIGEDGQYKKIYQIQSKQKIEYEFLRGEKSSINITDFNNFIAKDNLGAQITSDFGAGGILVVDNKVYELQYFDDDFYPVNKEISADGSSQNTRPTLTVEYYEDFYKNQAAIYLCECACIASIAIYGNVQKASELIESNLSESLDNAILDRIIRDTYFTNSLNIIFSIWGEGEADIQSQWEINSIKTLGSKLTMQIRCSPQEVDDNPVMDGEVLMNYNFDYAAGLDESHFAGILNKTAPQKE